MDVLNGTWEASLGTVKVEGKPDEFLLQDDTWRCGTCLPPLTVAADGRFHPVGERAVFDSMSIKAIDERTAEIRYRKDGELIMRRTLQVSHDGNVLTSTIQDATTPAPAIQNITTLNRVGPSPAGAHSLSGRWAGFNARQYSRDALNVAFHVKGRRVMSGSQGQSYTAEVDGSGVAVDGEANTMVAVRREGASGLRETYTRHGSEVAVAIVIPSADGASISVTHLDPRDGSKVSWSATKTTRDISLLDSLAQRLRLDD